MCSKKHINYDELLKIYKFISLGYSLKKIINLVNKNRSTIYRLIINNSKWNKGSSVFGSLKNTRFKNCSNLLNCKRNGITSCPNSCPNYKNMDFINIIYMLITVLIIPNTVTQTGTSNICFPPI